MLKNRGTLPAAQKRQKVKINSGLNEEYKHVTRRHLSKHIGDYRQ